MHWDVLSSQQFGDVGCGSEYVSIGRADRGAIGPCWVRRRVNLNVFRGENLFELIEAETTITDTIVITENLPHL